MTSEFTIEHPGDVSALQDGQPADETHWAAPVRGANAKESTSLGIDF